MARARNIKPGFFANEDLAECSFAARLCFAGLWTIADREGRLEDRPKRIKGELFRFDSIEVEPLLQELRKHGFIARYEVDGLGIIQIIAFSKHQNPHHREPPSDLPPPESPGLDPVSNPPKPEASPQCDDPKARGKPEASPGINPQDTTCQGGRAVLIPDSGFLIPDSPSLIPDPGKGGQREVRSPSGSRIPPDFPTEADVGWCKAERPELDVAEVAAKFRDYWLGVAGAKGRKADWPATWRNFVRSEWSRSPSARSQPARASPTRQDRITATVAELTGRTRNQPEIVDVVAVERAS